MKAQLSLEFLYAAGAAMLIAAVLIIGAGRQFSDLKQDSKTFLVKDLAANIRSELFIASEAEEGYTRELKLPHNLSGEDYSITTIGSTIIFTSDDVEYPVKAPLTQGSLAKGRNTLRKSGGLIYVSQ
ncbi:hypothetical protein HYY74_03465 [Candidatus Woesearchaeota archaeon]|nr:hypothetical protein [Candidatus Woesearchaeota archaeon]